MPMTGIWKDSDGWAVEIYAKGSRYLLRTISTEGLKSKGSQLADLYEEIAFIASIEANIPKPYADALRKLGRDPNNYRRVGNTLFRVAALPFVSGVLDELRSALEKDRDARQSALRSNVPGLEALRVALDDEQRYTDEFNRMMEDGSNDGARPPKPVTDRPETTAAKYPIAAAYLQAEAWEGAANYAKASAGRKAKSRIAAGENHETVLAEMKAEWSAHCEEHAWD